MTADLPPAATLQPVQTWTPEEVATLAEELASLPPALCALLLPPRTARVGRGLFAGLLTADVPRKNVVAMALRLLGAGPHAERQVRALQQFIGEGAWDDEALLAEHQRLVNETDSARTMEC